MAAIWLNSPELHGIWNEVEKCVYQYCLLSPAFLSHRCHVCSKNHSQKTKQNLTTMQCKVTCHCLSLHLRILWMCNDAITWLDHCEANWNWIDDRRGLKGRWGWLTATATAGQLYQRRLENQGGLEEQGAGGGGEVDEEQGGVEERGGGGGGGRGEVLLHGPDEVVRGHLGWRLETHLREDQKLHLWNITAAAWSKVLWDIFRERE